jgi:hypothetical protein
MDEDGEREQGRHVRFGGSGHGGEAESSLERVGSLDDFVDHEKRIPDETRRILAPTPQLFPIKAQANASLRPHKKRKREKRETRGR